MTADLLNLAKTGAITVILAVTAWFVAYAAMGWLGRAFKGIVSMIRKHRTNIDRRTFPSIAWGITGLVIALVLILVMAKCTRG